MWETIQKYELLHVIVKQSSRIDSNNIRVCKEDIERVFLVNQHILCYNTIQLERIIMYLNIFGA